jgi:hypothetical protein
LDLKVLTTTNRMKIFEHIFVNTFNRLVNARQPRLTGGLPLGRIVVADKLSSQIYFVPTIRRTEHMVIQGKTGQGKSYLIRHIAEHDIKSGRGLILFDLHGDLILPILYLLARSGVNPSRVILMDPGNRQCAVGINPIETNDDQTRFLLVAEVTRTLADRWDFKGARTEELLRNALFVLSANGMTLLEVGLLLSHDGFRAQMLKRVKNQDVRDYFLLRFDPLSDAMKSTMREPVLNKLSEFCGDPHFRYILGQRQSTVSFDDVLAEGKIVLVNLNKGLLGIHAITFGSLVLGAFRAAIFRRKKRDLFAAVCDEVQNLVTADTDFDVLLAEARKFGIGLVTANQFAAQLPPKMRSAVQAIGTRVFFQLSSEDASHVAPEIDGGRELTERLRNLPARHFIVKSGNHRVQEVVTPDLSTEKVPVEGFVNATNAVYANEREEIDADILARRPKPESLKEVVDDWT